MNRVPHQSLQAVRPLHVIPTINQLEKQLLKICLVSLVLNDLAKFQSVNFSRNLALHFIKNALLAAQNRLHHRCQGQDGAILNLVLCERIIFA